MAYEEISQVKTSRLSLGDGIELVASGKKFITMGAGDALNAILIQYLVESATGSAICVGDEYVLKLLEAGFDFCFNS